MQNILSIDLDSVAHMDVDNQETSAQKKKKDNGHLIKAADCILDTLERKNTKATFFIVAEVYDWHPELIEKIQEKGHEIGFHSYSHTRLLNKDILIDELKKSSKFIKKFKPRGFRAPQIFLTADSFSILEKHGFEYDSSSYGNFKDVRKIGKILEIPVSFISYSKNKQDTDFPKPLNFRLIKNGIPIGSGYFIGLFGKSNFSFIRRLNKTSPYVMFIHPWQKLKTNLRKYYYLKEH